MTSSPSGARAEDWLNAPNLLSLVRVPLGFAFLVALPRFSHRPWPLFLILVVAAVTDVADGALARRQRKHIATNTPSRGSWLDPLCDKIFTGLALIAFARQHDDRLPWLAAIYTRELVQIPASLTYRIVPWLQRALRYDFSASRLGKATTVAQFFALGVLLLAPALVSVPALAAAALGLVAVVQHITRAARAARARRSLL